MSDRIETSTTYHRHISTRVSLPERVSIMAGATPERYDFCLICNCVPEGFLGQIRVEQEGARDERSN